MIDGTYMLSLLTADMTGQRMLQMLLVMIDSLIQAIYTPFPSLTVYLLVSLVSALEVLVKVTSFYHGK